MRSAFPFLAAVAMALAAPGDAIIPFTGAPLTRSVGNEADAAIDRACAWLASVQEPDGSWRGGTAATAVAVLALGGSGEDLPEQWRGTVARGLDWLEADAAATTNAPATPAEGETSASAAWRGIALRCFRAAAAAGEAAPIALPEPGDSLSDAERDFRTAYAANVAPEATSGGAGEALPPDWRQSLAARWTTSQEIDRRGRGHWGASPLDTAFAVLLLKEL